jgi:mono/diheme cytochrome c family protein
MMRFLRDAALTIVLLLVVAAVFGFFFTRNGLSARTEPPRLEALVAGQIRHLAIPSHAAREKNPLAGDPNVWVQGGKVFVDECAVCHGDDGRGKSTVGRNLYPKVPDMSLAETQGWSDGELYFIISNGVRYTGMPAWGGEHSPEEIWRFVSYVRKMPKLTPEDLEKVGPFAGQ